jgi:hypothetical protein
MSNIFYDFYFLYLGRDSAGAGVSEGDGKSSSGFSCINFHRPRFFITAKFIAISLIVISPSLHAHPTRERASLELNFFS